MPNWCMAAYVIEGDKEEIADLFQKLQTINDFPDTTFPSFGKLWLGNVVKIFGGDPEQIYCRGEFNDIPQFAEVITFDTMTAWSEMNEVWDFVVSKYKSLRYFYSAEEGGNGYFVTNDKEGRHFPHRFLIDEWDGEPEYCDTEEVVLESISERIDMEVSTWGEMEEALKKYNEENEGQQMFIQKFTVV